MWQGPYHTWSSGPPTIGSAVASVAVVLPSEDKNFVLTPPALRRFAGHLGLWTTILVRGHLQYA